MSSTASTSASPPLARELHEALLTPGPGRLQVATSLLSRGADINGLYEPPPRGRVKGGGSLKERTRATPLYAAARRGDLEAVQFLLDSGADVHKRNQTSVSILTSPFPEGRARETLSGLDGMRLSNDTSVVELAEHLFGKETDEEAKSRKGAFDDVPMWPPMQPAPTAVKVGLKKTEQMKQKRTATEKVKEKRKEKKEVELDDLRNKRKVDEADAAERKVYNLRSKKSTAANPSSS